MEIERLPFGQSLSDKQRAAHYKWLGMPSGLTPELASRFMLCLHGGKTVRDMTGYGEHHLCSAERFKKHCELNPEWGQKVRKLSDENTTKKKKAYAAAKTLEFCANRLHQMTPNNVKVWKSGRRQCIACWNYARINPPIHSILPVLDQIKEKLSRGTSQGEIISGKPTGGGKTNRSLILVRPNVFYAYRKQNPDFDQFVRQASSGSSSRGQVIRHTRVRTAARREESSDYYKIRCLIPESNPHRDDIVARIFEDMLSGVLKREEVPSRIKNYVAEFNRLYPTKYAKFGDGSLVSLDEVLFDDGSTTRGDNVTRGLWD